MIIRKNMKISDLPTMFCPCGAEMIIGEKREDSTVAAWGPSIATVYAYGKLMVEISGALYVCSAPDCQKSAQLIFDYPA